MLLVKPWRLKKANLAQESTASAALPNCPSGLCHAAEIRVADPAGIPSLLAHMGRYPYIPVQEVAYPFNDLLLLVRLGRGLRETGDPDPPGFLLNISKYGEPPSPSPGQMSEAALHGVALTVRWKGVSCNRLEKAKGKHRAKLREIQVGVWRGWAQRGHTLGGCSFFCGLSRTLPRRWDPGP